MASIHSDSNINRLSSIQSTRIGSESQVNRQQRQSASTKNSDDQEAQNRGDSEQGGSVSGSVSQNTLLATSQSEGSDTDSSGGNFNREQTAQRDIYQPPSTIQSDKPFDIEQKALQEAYQLLGKDLPLTPPTMNMLDF